MQRQRSLSVCLLTLSLLPLGSPTAFAAEQVYSWMLPKTVIDVQIVYALRKCDNVTDKAGKQIGVQLSFNATPTLTPRATPDLVVGRLEVSTDNFNSFFQDRNISITTSAGSHILGSIGSNPTDQTAAIIGNILGGAVKLVGIAYGVPVALAAAAGTPAVVVPSCGDAQKAAKNVQDYKKIIQKLELDLQHGNTPDDQPIKKVDDQTIKSDTAQIQAYQTLMAEEQAKLSLTVKERSIQATGFPLMMSLNLLIPHWIRAFLTAA